MPGVVEGFATERAGFASGRDDAARAGRELTRGAGAEEHADGIRAVLGVVEHHTLVELTLGDGQEFYHHGLGFRVPAESHRADPEFGIDRHDEGAEVFDP